MIFISKRVIISPSGLACLNSITRRVRIEIVMTNRFERENLVIN